MARFAKLRAQVNSLDVTDEVRSLALTLLAAMKGQLPAPAEALRGYWPTVRLYWGSGTVEVEVHDSWYELYQLHEGETGIQQFRAADLSALLAAASPIL